MTSTHDIGPVLVTGGTGTLGRCLVPRLLAAGVEVRVLSRGKRSPLEGVEHVVADLATGEGVDAAVAGAPTIVHLAGSNKGDEVKAGHLTRAAARAGARHLVFISVVGADRVPVSSAMDRAMYGYYGSKRAAERVVAESGVPWTTLRATQFHDLILVTARAMARLPVIPVPSLRFQPVDTDEVAARLAELALGPPAGLVADLGGPRTYELRDLVRGYVDARHKHRAIVPLRIPGQATRVLREGANLAPDHAVGRRTWEEFLAGAVG